MAQIREIKKRIKSIANTKKVTHAMELVAAAKMRKAQLNALSGRPYSLSLNEIIEQIRTNSGEISHELLETKDSGAEIIILVTSDRGLAGGLNMNLFREILRSEVKNVKFITIGKKATTFAAKIQSQILASFESEEKTTLDLARTITKLATDCFLAGEVAKISILYSHFDSIVKQTPTWIQLFPIEFEQQPTNLQTYKPTNLLFEPSTQDILKTLLPHYILTKIYQILLEAKASEHSARMVAMKNATDAAGDLIEDLTLTYNQARQEAITTELLDIVTAQKAFK